MHQVLHFLMIKPDNLSVYNAVDAVAQGQNGGTMGGDDIGVAGCFFQDVLQQKCTVKDAMFYSDESKVHCIQFGQDNTDADPSYSSDDMRRVLSDCLEYADIILINGTAWNLPQYAQIWNEAVDASIALCRQDDADYFKVDQMLNDLQNSDTYFAGCILFGF